MLLQQIQNIIEQQAPEILTAIQKTEQEKRETFTLEEINKMTIDLEDTEIIKNRFLCRSGIAMLSAQTGCGKSSFVMQLAICFALKRQFIGLVPAKKIRTLLIQGENDLGDLQEEIRGVCRGLTSHEKISEAELREALNTVTVKTCTNQIGSHFIDYLDETLNEAAKDGSPFDLVVIDPLFSFIGVDVSKQQGAVSVWIRNGLMTTMRKHNAAAILVHHTNKPQAQQKEADAYSYAGSAELANAVRAILTIEKMKDDDERVFYQVTAPKRGSRLGLDWKKYIRWAETGGIYWEAAPPPPTKEEAAQAKENERLNELDDLAWKAVDLLKENEPVSKNYFCQLIGGQMGIGNHSKQGLIVDRAIVKGYINQRPAKPEDSMTGGCKEVLIRPICPGVRQSATL